MPTINQFWGTVKFAFLPIFAFIVIFILYRLRINKNTFNKLKPVEKQSVWNQILFSVIAYLISGCGLFIHSAGIFFMAIGIGYLVGVLVFYKSPVFLNLRGGCCFGENKNAFIKYQIIFALVSLFIGIIALINHQ